MKLLIYGRKMKGFLHRFCQNVNSTLPPFPKADAKVGLLGI